MKFISRYLLLVFSLALPVAASAGTLTASADRTEISLNETFELTVSYDEQVFLDEPDFSVLADNFHILQGPFKQQSYSNVNGKTTSSSSWTLVLQPKAKGTFTIPAFELDGEKSSPLTIIVKEEKTPAEIGSDVPLFVETILDKEEIYVGEQLLLTYRVYLAEGLNNLSPPELQLPDDNLIDLGISQFRKVMNGQQFNVAEFKFAIFPKKNGAVSIPQVSFSAYLPSSRRTFFGDLYRNGQRFSALSQPREIKVKPQPASSSLNWIPSRDVQITETWSDADAEWLIGEPKTRTITIIAEEITEEQIPDIELRDSNDYSIYPDKPERTQQTDAGGVSVIYQQSFAVVPSKAGLLTFPEVTLQWWDTAEQTMRTATLPERRFNIQPAAHNSYTPPIPDDNIALQPVAESGNSLLWMSLSANGVLLICILWLLFRRPPKQRIETATAAEQTSGNERELFSAIRSAAKDNNAKQLRKAILAWGQHYWKSPALSTLNEIADRLADTELEKQLKALDRSLYGHSADSPDLTTLATDLKRWRANGSGSPKSEDGLKPLYPQ